ncbi:hypothetical protein [Niabella hirudinis]|uniref:hypothetical protein n=1 Tax=Niabella hirudinis TaxID=1285929 RepID=UPI003EBFD314
MNNPTNPLWEKPEDENSFLKMKLALETGGHVKIPQGVSKYLTPEMENEFLKSIMALQEQRRFAKTVRLYDKIGKPLQFLPEKQIPDKEIEYQYNALLDYLFEHNFDFCVCSPNVTTRDLYRFITEELFFEQVDDIEMPEMICGFVYDDFHPDPIYENTLLIKEQLLPDIFREGDPLFFDRIHQSSFSFNRESVSPDVFKARIQRFKTLCGALELLECSISTCTVKDKDCTVKGFYHARATISPETLNYTGLVEAHLKKGGDGYWDVVSLFLENFNP